MALYCSFFSVITVYAEEYSATVTYSETFGLVQNVGRVVVSGSNALLEIDMGTAGLASFFFLQDQSKVYVVAHNLKAYVVFDFWADSKNFADLLSKLAITAIPLDLPVLSFFDLQTTSAGSEVWQNEIIDVQRCKYFFGFLGTAWEVEAFLWQPERLRPFPWKMIGIRSFSENPSDYEIIGPLIELVDIDFSPQNQGQFEPLLTFRKMYSVVDLLFFTLIPHLN